jgi:hypothetical protein
VQGFSKGANKLSSKFSLGCGSKAGVSGSSPSNHGKKITNNWPPTAQSQIRKLIANALINRLSKMVLLGLDAEAIDGQDVTVMR